jgi:sugar O-acyltransferase (sialic acid O-acetyltransferase NeuD family)
MNLVLIGAGGHALVVLDAAQAGKVEIAGLLDAGKPAGSQFAGARVLGDDALLDDPSFVAAHGFHISVCDPSIKNRIVPMLTQRHIVATAVTHPGAVVSREAHLAAGVFVNAGAVVNAGAEIGAHTVINTRASVDHGSRVGAVVHVSPGVTVCGDVVIGDGAVIGPGAVVGRGVHIGAEAVVGAGAVVLDDIDAQARVAGSPARPILKRD